MKVEVLGSINSGRYNVGDVVDLPRDVAKSLERVGVVRPSKLDVTLKGPRDVEQHIQWAPPKAEQDKEE